MPTEETIEPAAAETGFSAAQDLLFAKFECLRLANGLLAGHGTPDDVVAAARKFAEFVGIEPNLVDQS